MQKVEEQKRPSSYQDDGLEKVTHRLVARLLELIKPLVRT
jgi:hypothetical protein